MNVEQEQSWDCEEEGNCKIDEHPQEVKGVIQRLINSSKLTPFVFFKLLVILNKNN